MGRVFVMTDGKGPYVNFVVVKSSKDILIILSARSYCSFYCNSYC